MALASDNRAPCHQSLTQSKGSWRLLVVTVHQLRCWCFVGFLQLEKHQLQGHCSKGHAARGQVCARMNHECEHAVHITSTLSFPAVHRSEPICVHHQHFDDALEAALCNTGGSFSAAAWQVSIAA